MSTRKLAAVVPILALFIAGPYVYAQEPAAEIDALRKEISARKEAMEELTRQIVELRNEKSSANDGVVQKYYDSLILHYRYEDSLRNHTHNILQWQLISAYVVLLLVVLVTCLGTALSYWEVSRSLKIPLQYLDRTGGTSEAAPSDVLATTTLEISPQRLQITSAVTGVVILVLSLGFLYLFVDRVLELKPIDLSGGMQPREQVPQKLP